MKKSGAFIYIFVLFFFQGSDMLIGQEQVNSVKSLITRIFPKHAGKFELVIIPSENGKDVFEIEQKGEHIILKGNSGVSLASAFNWYLKYTAKVHLSDCGDRLDLPNGLPSVTKSIRIVSPLKYRFNYNYCTFSYTMAGWNWERWEREIDLMAMRGINLAMILTGHEAVWRNTLIRLGYSDEEARAWLAGPAYLPWQFMANIEGCMGPLPKTWFEDRINLARKIFNRMSEFGINPVYQLYYGMVPNEFHKKFPNVKFLSQGLWLTFQRPGIIDPHDAMFKKIAAIFYDEQEKLFGKGIFYAGDPFHEGGNTHNLDRGECAKLIQNTMLEYNPGGIWVKQCWQHSNEDMFAAGKRENFLALDLFSDTDPFWKNAKGYSGTPWIWCFLENFGGNQGMSGQINKLVNGFYDALNSTEKKNLAGMGFTMEGTGNNPVLYEIASEFAWRNEKPEINKWINDYIQRRYGTLNPSSIEAWKILLETAYTDLKARIEPPGNAFICARPDLTPDLRARTWSSSGIPYDVKKLAKAWEKLVEAGNTADPYKFDIIDLGRQALANYSKTVHLKIVDAYKNKDRDGVQKFGEKMIELANDINNLLSTREEFLLGKGINSFTKWGKSEAEKNLYELNAKMIITLWDGIPGSELNDYANREYAGLLSGFYGKRWELFYKYLVFLIDNNKSYDKKEFVKISGEFEQEWVKNSQAYPDKPTGDAIQVSKELVKKYMPMIEE